LKKLKFLLLVYSTHKVHSEVGVGWNACSTHEQTGRSCFIVWASSFRHCLAALDHGAGVDQQIDCLIIQNRQAVQSTGRSVDWTLEDNMVDGLLFWATLTGRRGDHTPFVQAGAETSDTGAEANSSCSGSISAARGA